MDRTERTAVRLRVIEKTANRLPAADKPWEGLDLRLHLQPAVRSGDVVVKLRDAVVQRGSFRLGPLTLEIGWGERVAIVGPNGSGKTTLLRALTGLMPLTAGERYLGPGVVMGEVDQGRERFLTGEALLGAFSAASGLGPEPTRSLLAKFGLSAEHADRAGATLSSGERTRVLLALMAARGVNCLVLDEPTNHLDLPAIDELEAALERYLGTLLLVTHDRRLLEAVRIGRTVPLGTHSSLSLPFGGG